MSLDNLGVDVLSVDHLRTSLLCYLLKTSQTMEALFWAEMNDVPDGADDGLL